MIQHAFVQANGLRFHVAQCGGGDRLALLLHGFPERWISWRYQMPLLARLGLEKFKALPDFASSPLFSERERAVLAYTEEVTRRRSVSDAIFETLRKHASEREIVEITWLNAVGNFFNLMAVPLGLESDGFTELALRRAQGRPADLRA